MANSAELVTQFLAKHHNKFREDLPELVQELNAIRHAAYAESIASLRPGAAGPADVEPGMIIADWKRKTEAESIEILKATRPNDWQQLVENGSYGCTLCAWRGRGTLRAALEHACTYTAEIKTPTSTVLNAQGGKGFFG